MKYFTWTLIVALGSWMWGSHDNTKTIQYLHFAPVQDTMKHIELRSFDRLGYRADNDSSKFRTVVGHVKALHEGTWFFCDSAIYNIKERKLEAFGNIHINDGDSIHTYGDYLRYHADRRYAYLQKNVRLTDGKAVLTTNELEYDVALKIGIYKNGGKVVNGKSVLTSEEAYYYSDIKDAYFKRNVVLNDPQYNLKADSLLYNLTTETARFITKTTIIDSSKRKITTSEGYYDLKNGVAQFGLNPVIEDGAVTVTGNKIAFDEKTGISQAEGNAVLVDTAQGITILANQLFSNRNSGALLATKKPLLIIKQKTDSIYVAADTLFSGKLSDLATLRDSTNADTLKGLTIVNTESLKDKKDTAASDTASRYFEAYRNVRIFSDSLQAVCDSLFYSGKDSIFRMFRDPVAWANKTQISGDTMYLYTQNKQPLRAYVFNNAIAVNETAKDLYNQIKGFTINAYFINGNIDYIRAKGEAESIYYVMDDDSAYVGTNRMTADAIDMRFDSTKELSQIAFINQPKGTQTPIKQVNVAEMRLRGFRWLEARRPKTKYELFE